jgi:hypothetical protein
MDEMEAHEEHQNGEKLQKIDETDIIMHGNDLGMIFCP